MVETTELNVDTIRQVPDVAFEPKAQTEQPLSIDTSANGPMVIPTSAQLQNMNASDARAMAADLRALATRLDPNSTAYQQVMAMEREADARATQAAIEEDADDSIPNGRPSRLGRMFPPIAALERAIFNYMTHEEQHYLQSIDPNKQYLVQKIDANGNVVEGAAHEVSGAELREDVARVKLHTLSKEDQEKVRAEEEKNKKDEPGHSHDGEAKSPQAKEKEEMQKLQKSLDNLEGHEAQKTLAAAEEASKGKSSEEQQQIHEEARRVIRERHEHFHQAKEEAQKIIAKTEEVEKKEEHVKGLEALASAPPVGPMGAMPQLMAKLALPEAEKNLERSKQEAAKDIDGMKSELGETLQKKVIDQGLLGKEGEKDTKEKSQTVAISHDKEFDKGAHKEVAAPVLAQAAPARQSAGINV